MKNTLFYLSLVLMVLWIIGFLVLKLQMTVHILLFLSLIIYIRSVLFINNNSSERI